MRKWRLYFFAGLPLTVPVSAAAQDFGGPRVEARIGYDHLSADLGRAGRQSGDGLSYGGALGYDFDLGHLVIGAEADFGFSTAEVAAGSSASASARRELGLGARMGYKLDADTLVYAAGGYANGRFRFRGPFLGNAYVNNDGFRVGAGLERRISDNAFAKLEYRYVNYRTRILEPDRHQIIGGVGLRF